METQIEQTTRSGRERDKLKKARTAQRRARSNPENTKERLAHWIQPYARGAEHADKRKMIQHPKARNMNKMRKITSESVINHICESKKKSKSSYAAVSMVTFGTK